MNTKIMFDRRSSHSDSVYTENVALRQVVKHLEHESALGTADALESAALISTLRKEIADWQASHAKAVYRAITAEKIVASVTAWISGARQRVTARMAA